MRAVPNRWLASFAAVVMLMGACGGEDEAGGNDSQANTSARNEKVTLLLPFTHSASFAHYYIAQDRGYFDQCGIDLEFKSASNVPNPAQLAVQKAVDYAIIDPITYISGVHRDLPLVAISEDTARTGVSYFSLEETGIESPEDLRGRVVALNPGDDNRWFLEKIMADYLSPEERDQVEIVPASYSINPLLSGVVDVYGTWIDDASTIVAEQKGFELNAIKSYDYGIRTAGNLLVTHEDNLAANPDIARRFLAAVSAGLEAVTSPGNADEVVDAALARMDEPPSRDVMLQVYNNWLTLQQNPLYGEKGVGWHDPAAYEETQQFLLDNGVISNEMPVEDLYTTDVLEQVFVDGKVDLEKACG